jgi:bacteriocin resistance YdeI/OmpD-like protein/uncharacterized protein DUF1905
MPVARNKPQKIPTAISFRSKLVPANLEHTAGWTVALPKSVSAKFPTRGATAVEGAINRIPFRVSLKADRKGGQHIPSDKIMRDSFVADGDDAVTVEITRIGDEAEHRIPADLRQALAEDPAALAGWQDITPMARRDWVFYVLTAKQAETRARRIAKACDMLASGKRRLCCFPGVKWMMEKNAKSCGMWLPLPSSSKTATLPVKK